MGRRERRKRSISPRRRRERQASLRLVVGGVLLACAIAVVGILLVLRGEWNPQIDPETFCPTEDRIGSEVLILLDATDSWNAVQRVSMQQVLDSIRSSVPPHSRIHLYTLEEDGRGPSAPVLSLCRPRTAQDFEDFPVLGERGAAVVANPEMLDQWHAAFTAAVDSIFRSQVDRAEARQSPIMETLRGAALQVNADFQPPGPLEVYLFSDMLQHSENFSHYGGTPWSTDIARALGDLSEQGTSAMSGASVVMYLLDRDEAPAGPERGRGELVDFWDAFFLSQDALLTRVRRIES